MIMMTNVIGIDHIYISVSDLKKSEVFYDNVMIKILGFRKNQFNFADELHIQYFNRHFGFVIRPARTTDIHNPYSVGLHHLCFRVNTIEEVITVSENLIALGIPASKAKLYSEYAPDYWATHFEDLDGVRLEVTNYRVERRERHDHW